MSKCVFQSLRSSSSSASHESSSSTTAATDSSVPSIIKFKPTKKEESKNKMKKEPKSTDGGGLLVGGGEKIKHNVLAGKRQSLSSSPSSKDSRLESHCKEAKRSKSSEISRHESLDNEQLTGGDLKRTSRDISPPPRPPPKKVKIDKMRYPSVKELSNDDILTKEVVANEPDTVAATNTDTSSLTKEEPVVEESTNITPSDVIKSGEISKVVSDTGAGLLHRHKSETIASDDEEDENEFDQPEFLDELDEDSNDENDYRNDYPDDDRQRSFGGYNDGDEEDDDYDDNKVAYDPEFYQLQKLMGLKICDEDDNDSVDSDDENGHPSGHKGRLYAADDDDDSDEVDYLGADREEYSTYIDDDYEDDED